MGVEQPHKKEVMKIYEELLEKGDKEEAKKIMKSIKDTDEELAFQQYKLMSSLVLLTGMCVARVTGMVVDRLLDKYF